VPLFLSIVVFFRKRRRCAMHRTIIDDIREKNRNHKEMAPKNKRPSIFDLVTVRSSVTRPRGRRRHDSRLVYTEALIRELEVQKSLAALAISEKNPLMQITCHTVKSMGNGLPHSVKLLTGDECIVNFDYFACSQEVKYVPKKDLSKLEERVADKKRKLQQRSETADGSDVQGKRKRRRKTKAGNPNFINATPESIAPRYAASSSKRSKRSSHALEPRYERPIL
jgi:hypothetical protein